MDVIKETEFCDVYEVHPERVMEMRQSLPEDGNLKEMAELFKVFGDYSRLRILSALLQQETCVCDLADALGMTQSAVSHQLKVLRQARLVGNRRSGKTVYYFLTDDHVRTILKQGFEHIREL